MPAETAPRVILASGSPRRRELLGNLGVPFEVVVSGEAEDSQETDPARLALELGQLKARAVAAQHPDAVVIAADTVVALGGTLLAKPADEAENAAFLRQQSGKTQQVYTGVCVISPAGEQSGVERTDVTFRALTEAEVTFYARSGEGLDKAGGYGIQGVGMALIERVEGDYSNIVGFPLALVLRLLRGAGVSAFGV
ncbi:Maf family nucleotide pyrophosphatase [Deinococcus radiodurans]|jgi:MAF protein|uniref:dTTP/UTP pyrophosphatase n=1 Tax=Deinococcus radiodurans (strain ATCC 13939 / DSM 20539 / JCM 16871 / CCUG 27074 / LMG 4051 / NBRC 15346 / NCIMB 9279 / VKM B-1422 / R1) TaxID=243230 RepID=NTPPA_DEIRA|nr:Maf family nucleotide pyrophosphatase [Deinococcus radiodurans]Q9RV24.1 RecName: Full=dTTP/UTP pyrophosphatase; Short=dTTPase/UTPase; AltName: Full=Nucleoside triphosphate pyrophosphatase; AltName: Full=Nucleotide pyrophosphatase; Short=Nucleotide PPase [Deinococcus radiodurans R1 = ATCC 13939 = DSM 20539]AAF10776.1 maf protein [Deinococcus radiodurans R1 = ATCC 13939 = DSM 20539]ANC71626.1 septum formation inhibitor Maf [Deinococcus radiodurans R1 = ATCC 13939 = DSM 20539]QEM70683.1 septum 